MSTSIIQKIKGEKNEFSNSFHYAIIILKIRPHTSKSHHNHAKNTPTTSSLWTAHTCVSYLCFILRWHNLNSSVSTSSLSPQRDKRGLMIERSSSPLLTIVQSETEDNQDRPQKVPYMFTQY